MRVKRYVVDTMPDALQRIRSDLGKDAVILNTKEIRSGGFMGMFSKKKIEVIAAIDANLRNSTRPSGYANSTSVDAMLSAKSAVATLEKQKPPQHEANASAKPLQNPPPQISPLQPSSVTASQDDHTKLLKELQQMKQMMERFTRQQNETIYPHALEKLIHRFREQELSQAIIDQISQAAMEQYKEADTEMSEEEVKSLARDQLRGILLEKPVHEIEEHTKIVHFVGPTGVGKTTTIAKLAACQALKNHKKVGFITSDTYRIAAVEQLKTYANILDVPLEVVNSHQDLAKSFERLKEVDLIFMDTAGRNYRNEMYVSELNSLLHTKMKSETYLVLSMTMKYQDMKTITTNFSKFSLDKVLFTKMDETETYGSIFNLINEFALQPSYLANGQNVPDDIVKLNADNLIDLIMEEPHE